MLPLPVLPIQTWILARALEENKWQWQGTGSGSTQDSAQYNLQSNVLRHYKLFIPLMTSANSKLEKGKMPGLINRGKLLLI